MNANRALKFLSIVLLLQFPCLAQAQWSDRTANFAAAAGYSGTVGNTSTYLDGGFVIGGAVELSPELLNPFVFRFNLNYSQYNATIGYLNQAAQTLSQEVDSGTGSVVSGTANILYRIPIAYGIRAYGLAGIGAYYTRIELDQALPFSGGYGCGYGCGYRVRVWVWIWVRIRIWLYRGAGRSPRCDEFRLGRGNWGGVRASRPSVLVH